MRHFSCHLAYVTRFRTLLFISFPYNISSNITGKCINLRLPGVVKNPDFIYYYNTSIFCCMINNIFITSKLYYVLPRF